MTYCQNFYFASQFLIMTHNPANSSYLDEEGMQQGKLTVLRIRLVNFWVNILGISVRKNLIGVLN